MRAIRLLTISIMTFSTCFAFADLNNEMSKFFNSVGASSSVDTAEVYNGQKAGYATGGGLTVRNRVMNSKLMTINLPSFDAGCGGIDIFAGGFSFINDEQLVNTLKSVGSSAIGYAFLLGLETVSPQVANTIKQLQTWSNNVNSMGINSCEIASQMVGSVWPKDTMAKQQICRSMGNKEGMFSDYVSARHKCSVKSGYEKQMDSKKEELNGLLVDEYNIAWEVIQKQQLLASDESLAQFFMTLLGTIIKRKDQVEIFPSKVHNESFLQRLLEGGETEIYKCVASENKKCLVVKSVSTKIDESQAWLGRVRDLLVSMQKKMLADEELSEQEKLMLTKTRLPLYKIVSVLTAYKGGQCPIDLYQVADIVAMDLITQYLREAISLVREGAQQLRQGQMYADAIDQYLIDLDRIEKTVHYYETRSMNLIDREFQTIQKIQLIEDQIASEIRID